MSRAQRGEPDLPPGPARDLVDLYRRLRQSQRLSGGQIAVKTGLSAGHISDVLHGWSTPSPDAAMKIASALGASPAEVASASRLAGELADLKRYNRSRRASPDSQVVTAAPRSPAVASGSRAVNSSEIHLYRILGLSRQPERYVGTVTGDIRRVRCADVWVNPENTEMVMARFDEFSVSSIIRYEGARRDDVGRVVDDVIADELNGKVAGRRPVLPGTAIRTGPGELARFNVSHVVHVAAVQGEPGAGYRQIREIGRCVTNVLTEIDRIDTRPLPRTVLFPLLGAGQGGGRPDATVDALVGSAIDYFASAPGSAVDTVYFLAYTEAELSACETFIDANSRLMLIKDK